MPENYFSFYVSKDRKDIIKLFRQLSTEGNLSNFIVEMVEIHHAEIIQNKLKHHKSQIRYYKKIAQRIEDRVIEERERREKKLKEQIKIVERYLNNMVEKRKYSDKSPAYSTIARYIKEDSGLKLTDEQVEKFYKCKLKGEEINLLEELLTTGGSE